MSTFNISNNTSNIDFSLFHINVKQLDLPDKPKKEFGYNDLLNHYRNIIDKIDPDIWKNSRWIINKFDFTVKGNVINRAFYKYWEIIHQFHIFLHFNFNDLVLHGAEAPGGFIQGSHLLLQQQISKQFPVNIPCIDDEGFTTISHKKNKRHKFNIFSISLNNQHHFYKSLDLPSYHKHILTNNVCITYGIDNTGNINNWENIQYILKLTKNKCFYLITADGGFDEGKDFNNKEQLHYSLILSEIFLAIQLQQHSGHFILKMFDIFTDTSIHFLYFLTFCYDQVYIYKPQTSRPTNSEKYIICKGFKLDSTQKTHCLNILKSCKKSADLINSKYISISLFKSIPKYFTQLIYDTNTTLLNTQCNYLQQAILLSSNKDLLDKTLNHSIQERQKTFQHWSKQFLFTKF